jgi:membrane-associated protease RseP (regulator of RpoE activity)
MGYLRIWHDPGFLLAGLPFSLTLLTILLAHEMGHYLACRYYRVDATLPFFLPAPTLIGTLGAFIRIRDHIPSKRALFDIGIAGPIAGFVTLLGPMAVGLSLSKVLPGIGHQGLLAFGTPRILRLFEMAQYPGIGESDLLLHPIVRAAWVGLLATALNLLPIGQLDGGHILYSFVGDRARPIGYTFIAGLLALGGYQLWSSSFGNGFSWLIWAALLFFFARRHPSIYDPRPLGPARGWLGAAALAMLLLSFTPSPVRARDDAEDRKPPAAVVLNRPL